jgi:hypothetical protein
MHSGFKCLATDFQGKANRSVSILDDGQSLCRHLMLWRWGIPNVEIYARVCCQSQKPHLAVSASLHI